MSPTHFGIMKSHSHMSKSDRKRPSGWRYNLGPHWIVGIPHHQNGTCCRMKHFFRQVLHPSDILDNHQCWHVFLSKVCMDRHPRIRSTKVCHQGTARRAIWHNSLVWLIILYHTEKQFQLFFAPKIIARRNGFAPQIPKCIVWIGAINHIMNKTKSKRRMNAVTVNMIRDVNKHRRIDKGKDQKTMMFISITKIYNFILK